MSGIKLPSRPAPQPPKTRLQRHNEGSSDKGYPFMERYKLSRSQSAGRLGETKKPPPRPPPPMKLLMESKVSLVAPYHKQLTQSLSTRNKPGGVNKKVTTTSGMLIDFNSPPSSPTLTACSSSDGFSLNSFGSDGVLTTFNNQSSQIESGFEDDFDLLMASTATTPSTQDPWGDDLFVNTRQPTKQTSSFDLSNEDPKYRHKVTSTSLATSAKPTIIRAKHTKPSRPPPPKLRPASTPPTFASLQLDEWSPPMPSCPPPPPPLEVLQVLDQGPSLPPRPSVLFQEHSGKKNPYCIALYDYEAGHPDDLSFKEGDTVKVTKRINNHWLYGECNGKCGQFPENYIMDPSSLFPMQTSYS
uniref:SH3 domain-containing protein n=1 Tax=Graphocephala atropunctata TaxID=36148 RepID=A0A1B6KCZ9_9HEMI